MCDTRTHHCCWTKDKDNSFLLAIAAINQSITDRKRYLLLKSLLVCAQVHVSHAEPALKEVVIDPARRSSQGTPSEDGHYPEGQGGNGGVEGRGPHHDAGPQLLPD